MQFQSMNVQLNVCLNRYTLYNLFIQVGSHVLKKDFTRKKRKGGKLDDRWLGPYTISKDLGKGFYSLSDSMSVIVKRVNGAHLKIYEDTHDDNCGSDEDICNESLKSKESCDSESCNDFNLVCVCIYTTVCKTVEFNITN